uniref:Uncharacterized protein LOC100177297 n=1 Tax=Phallusia mammillata TaxID=59560 RepID=A0A6F9DH64_9ASCI|nr:uncharacterized protein LOC100177297 [Phallusia mammillata]
MANKCCIALLSIINVGVALQTNVIQYAPQGKGGIWIDTEEINQKNNTLGVEKNSLLQVVGVPYFTQERKRGPKCFACSGLKCAIPRQTGQNAELQCDYGDVCWVGCMV